MPLALTQLPCWPTQARGLLESIKTAHSWLSYADLYVYAGHVALELAGGRRLPFRFGRRDFTPDEARARHGASGCPFGDGKFNPCGSRLPAADLGTAAAAEVAAPPSLPGAVPPAAPALATAEREWQTIAAVRGTFARMGFSDREAVLLVVLGHQLGRCHPGVSGYGGAWYPPSPAHWNVSPGEAESMHPRYQGLPYLRRWRMPEGTWREVEAPGGEGRRQFECHLWDYTFMALPSDMVGRGELFFVYFCHYSP